MIPAPHHLEGRSASEHPEGRKVQVGWRRGLCVCLASCGGMRPGTVLLGKRCEIECIGFLGLP